MSKRVKLTNGKDFIEVYADDVPSMEMKGWKLEGVEKPKKVKVKQIIETENNEE